MIVLIPLLIVLIGVLLYLYVQNHTFSSMIWESVDRIAALSTNNAPRRIPLESLPEPMQRYLRRVLPAEVLALVEETASFEAEDADASIFDSGLPLFARMRHAGVFRMEAGSKALPIGGEQYYSAVAPAFVWGARLRMNALLVTRIRDQYIEGKGSILGKLLAAFPVLHMEGARIDTGTLLRYLGEMPLFPTAFLTVEGLQWTPVDASRVGVRLQHRDVNVGGEFHFDDQGEIIAFHTTERFRGLEGEVPTPWTGRFGTYVDMDGWRLPSRLSAVWHLPEGDFEYGTFTVEHVDYNILHSF